MPIELQIKFKQFGDYLKNLNYIDTDTNRDKPFSEDDMKLYFGIYYFNQIPFKKIDEKDRSLYRDLKKKLYDTKNDDVKELLIDNGHTILPFSYIGNVNAILINENGYTGYGDPRGENTAKGY